MLQGEHSAILSTFIKLPLILSLRPFLSIFEWLFYACFTVYVKMGNHKCYSQLDMIGDKFLVQIFTVHVTKPKYWMSLC